MNKTTNGTIHGRTIELAEDLGLKEGQEVRVRVTSLPPAAGPATEGFRRSAGVLAKKWTEEDDRILEEIHQDRKHDSRPEISE